MTIFLQSCRMGAKAALAVLDAKPDTAPCVICLDGNKITKKPLMECVEKVHGHVSQVIDLHYRPAMCAERSS